MQEKITATTEGFSRKSKETKKRETKCLQTK